MFQALGQSNGRRDGEHSRHDQSANHGVGRDTPSPPWEYVVRLGWSHLLIAIAVALAILAFQGGRSEGNVSPSALDSPPFKQEVGSGGQQSSPLLRASGQEQNTSKRQAVENQHILEPPKDVLSYPGGEKPASSLNNVTSKSQYGTSNKGEGQESEGLGEEEEEKEEEKEEGQLRGRNEQEEQAEITRQENREKQQEILIRKENVELVEEARKPADIEVPAVQSTSEVGQAIEPPEESVPLPQCYSSPAADPSYGSWRKAESGVEASPTNTRPGSIKSSACSSIWAKDHKGEGTQPYWTWQPSTCALDAVDAGKFCRAMKGRKGLLFVGDSLTHVMVRTLAAVLRAKLLSNPPSILHYSACGGSLKFSWYRNDYLDVRKSRAEKMRCEQLESSCLVFASDSLLRQFDTLVVNAGAHKTARGLSVYQDQMATASRVLTASMKRLHGGQAILMVRNTLPGHWECTERMFDGPVNLDTALDLVAKGPPEFDWPSIVDKNKALEEAFSTKDGWKLLDVYAPTVLRADSHHGGHDCLHYCQPGPVDHWVVLFYNMLLVETSAGITKKET